MLRSSFLLFALLAFAVGARAQSGAGFGFEYRPAAQVVHGTDTLRNAWAGGFNAPQFSVIDLNGDGQNDLFAFDRETTRLYTFLSVPAPGTAAGRRWQYAPQYEALFPANLEEWVLLRDYDCDGRPDLFTYAGGGNIRVLRNVAVNGRPSFQLATPQVRFSYGSSSTANLLVGSNMPAIQDVNGDGKLDIMSYDFISSSNIGLFLNTSPGSCGGALAFTLITDTWGGIQACNDCATYQLNSQACFTAARPTHIGGHSLLLMDLDGDGDQDLLDGRDNCPELVRLLNQGTTAAPMLTQAGISATFPSASTPARVPMFPTGYGFDANFDGRLDLVVAPNMESNATDKVSLRNSVQLFENTAATGAPVLTQQPAGFLQNGMIDVSEGAAPAFGDLTGDGLPDLLLGNHADRVGTAYRATLSFYQNVGTRARPVLKLVSSDYLGLSTQALQSIKPVLVDLNRDGALDLAYGAWDRGTNILYYILNMAPAGQAAGFSAANAVSFKRQGPTAVGLPPATYPATAGVLPYAQGDMPCFTDVDNDGYVDLLIGTNEPREPGMALRYFRNRGRGPLDSAFVLMNNDFGRIRTNTGNRPVNLSPTVADFDGDGLPDLLTADATGLLRFYSDYRTQPGIFMPRINLAYNFLSGQYEATRLGVTVFARYGLAAADLDGDGAPELFVGTQAGGMLSYGTRNRVVSAARPDAARALVLSVFPNPATATVAVETAMASRVVLLDLTGRVVREAAGAQRRHVLALGGLAAGVYLVRAASPDGTTAVRRLLVQ